MSETQELVGCSPRNFTVTERLKDEKKRLEDRLAEVNQALNTLESNPTVAQTLDALAKLNIRL